MGRDARSGSKGEGEEHMSAAYFEDHPTDPNKVILRKKPYLDKGADYEHGFVDGMQYQMQSSVDKAVNAMSKREWVGLTDEEVMEMLDYGQYGRVPQYARNFVDAIEAKLKEKNHDV
jgi:hypothetical protein